ncbi:FAD:protein FMN transferase, partial [Sedimentibacter sp. B4]|uniref:FAD:protein FMN transferase n=1 Tax=Sedimentibacter sp. B4 TaxID=304766 RepID=UPI001E4D924E
MELSVADAASSVPAESRARALLDLVERTCSRFRPDSDLSRVNARAGSWVRCDPLLVAATVAGVEAAEHT